MASKVFKITADYRKDNPNKPTYLIVAKTERECRKLFKDTFSWLDIHKVELVEDVQPNKDMLFYRPE